MKQSFFERITGTISLRNNAPSHDDTDMEAPEEVSYSNSSWAAQSEPTVGELTVDVYQTNDMIVVQTMIAGVAMSELSVSVTRDMLTIKGKRESPKGVAPENYFYQELFWGAFARTVLLPAEIDTEEVEATEKNGLLTIKLPKIDKGRIQNVKVKSM